MRAFVVLGILAVLPSAKMFAVTNDVDCSDADACPRPTAVCTGVAADIACDAGEVCDADATPAVALSNAATDTPMAYATNRAADNCALLKDITIVGVLEAFERTTRHGRIVRAYRLTTDRGRVIILPAIKGPHATASPAAADLAANVGKRVKLSGVARSGLQQRKTVTRLLTISRIVHLSAPDDVCPTRVSSKKR